MASFIIKGLLSMQGPHSGSRDMHTFTTYIKGLWTLDYMCVATRATVRHTIIGNTERDEMDITLVWVN